MLINLQRKCCDCPCSLSTEDNKIFSLCPQLCDIDDVLKGYFYIDKELECGCEDPFLTYKFECVDCSYCNEEQEVEVVTLCPCGDPDYGFPCCKDPGFAPPELSTDTTTDSPVITQINPYVYPRPENTYNTYDSDGNILKTCVTKNCTFYIENGVLVYSSLTNDPKIEKCGCCCMLTDTQGNRIVAEPKCPKLCPNANEDPTNIEDYVYYVNADYECCQGILKAGCYSQCEDGSLPKNYCKCCDEENGETWGPCCGPGGPEPETDGGGEEEWPGQNLGCPDCWWSNACFGYYNACPQSLVPNSVCVGNDLNDDSNFICPLPDGSCPSGWELQSNNVIFCSTNPEFQEGSCECVAIALTAWGCFSECEQCQQFTTCEEFANYVFGCTNTPPEEVNLKYECPLSPPCEGWPENCNQGE